MCIRDSVYAALPDAFHNPSELKHLIGAGKADISLALASFVVLFFSTGLAAGSGAPGGLFMPMLTLGGACLLYTSDARRSSGDGTVGRSRSWSGRPPGSV